MRWHARLLGIIVDTDVDGIIDGLLAVGNSVSVLVGLTSTFVGTDVDRSMLEIHLRFRLSWHL